MATYRVVRLIGRTVLPPRPGDEGLTLGEARLKVEHLRMLARSIGGNRTAHRFKLEKEDLGTVRERCEQAITEAKEQARLYVVPCEWEVRSVDGEEFLVRRKRFARKG